MSYPYYSHNNDEDQDDDNDRYSRKGSVTTPNDFNPTFYNPFEIKHRRRISREQFKKLEKAFSDNPKPNGKIRQKLAEHVSMTPRGVQVWFQNRRAKAKQQKESKKKQEEMRREHQAALTNVEPVLFSAYNMIHSRSQSSSSSISCSESLPNCSSFTTIADEKLTYPIITTQTWHSDASTITAMDEDDRKLLKSPFTPVQTQMSAETDFSWMDNADSMVFQTPSINEHQFQTKNQGDHLLDAWAYITPNHNRYLGNGLAYNRNVADWIKTVSLASCNMELGDFLTNKKHSFEQDEAYWTGQQIMRRLSEPATSGFQLVNSCFGNHQQTFNK